MDRIFSKNLPENKENVFKKWVNNIQTAAYNGARTVYNTKESNTNEGTERRRFFLISKFQYY